MKWGVEVLVRSVTFLNKARAPRCHWESPWRASLGGGSGLRRGEGVTLVISSPPFKVCKVFNNPKRGVNEDCSGPSVPKFFFEQRLYFRIYFEDKKSKFSFCTSDQGWAGIPVPVHSQEWKPLIPFPELWEWIFSFPSRSRISGMLFFIPFPFPNYGNGFFHSLPVPELWEWIFFIPFPFPNCGNGSF